MKRFGDFTAVQDLSVDVSEGGIFGFLGANGAGKTTSLRMALDILRPTAGRMACISPDQLLYGKLVGVVAVGLPMIAVWIAFAVGVAFAMQGVVADFLRPALASVSSPWIGLALAYFFLAGYLAISMLFLAVGAVSDSMRDAQGHLTPIILAISIPFAAIASAVLQNPDGPLPRILSWIPLYAPFAMTARLGGGVEPAEVAGSGALLAVFIALEFVLVGRLFRANLLQAGQPMKLGDLRRLLTTRS